MPISEAWRRCPVTLSALHAYSGYSIVVFDGFTARHEDFEADSDKFEQASMMKPISMLLRLSSTIGMKRWRLHEDCNVDSCEGRANSIFWNRANTNHRKDVLRSEQTERYSSSSAR